MQFRKTHYIAVYVFLTSFLSACTQKESVPFKLNPQCQFTALTGKHITAVQLCSDVRTGNTVTVINDGKAYNVADMSYIRFIRLKNNPDPDWFFDWMVVPNHIITPYPGHVPLNR
ncbi:Uncharacterised protein [Serratia liquefaciens]|nr:Uncharacterised protein [Serratia liquefaciens]